MAILENRYIVIKRTDINWLTDRAKKALETVLAGITQAREHNGKNLDKKYIVVSEDWPMYQETVDKVLAYADEQEAAVFGDTDIQE